MRAIQQEVASRPAYTDLARVVAARLGQFPADGGIPSLDGIAADVAPGESAAVRGGEPIPAHLVAKASRALEAPVEDLVDQQIIGSAEVLAAVVPQMTALARLRDQVQAAGAGFQARFGPAVDGLAYVIAGGAFDVTGIAPDPGGGRRFLGWTAGPHWILTADASSNALGRPAST